MASLIDHEAVLVDFEAWLVADGRPSHGTDFLTRKLAELRAEHRVSESADQATLRRFSAHLTDSFFGLVPRPLVTSDPLTAGDPDGTHVAMGAGAPSDPPQEDECLPTPPTLPPSPPMRDSRPGDRRTPRRPSRVPATT